MSTNPTYNFSDFKIACGEATHVRATEQAKQDASYFNLKTERRILDFINNDGLGKLEYHNSKPWEKNPFPETIMVDAYKFRTLGIPGYIAFYYVTRTGKWIIKSFKRDRDGNKPIAEAFEDAMRTCIPWEPGEKDGRTE